MRERLSIIISCYYIKFFVYFIKSVFYVIILFGFYLDFEKNLCKGGV